MTRLHQIRHTDHHRDKDTSDHNEPNERASAPLCPELLLFPPQLQALLDARASRLHSRSKHSFLQRYPDLDLLLSRLKIGETRWSFGAPEMQNPERPEDERAKEAPPEHRLGVGSGDGAVGGRRRGVEVDRGGGLREEGEGRGVRRAENTGGIVGWWRRGSRCQRIRVVM